MTFSGSSYVDQVLDDLEVCEAVGQQRHSFDLGGCGDGQVDLPSPWLPATSGDCSSQTTPAAGCLDGDRQRVESRLDCGQSVGATCPLVRVVGDEDPKCNSVIEATLMAASMSAGTSSPISTEVSSRALMRQTRRPGLHRVVQDPLPGHAVPDHAIPGSRQVR